MKRFSRNLLSIIAAVIFSIVITTAHAQPNRPDYPGKPIRILIGLSPGGGIDIITRGAAYKLSERLGQPVVVDNRPGSGSIIAMDLASQSAPDGYTLFSGTDTIQLLGATKRLSYDIRKAFDPVVHMSSQWFLLVTTPSLPVRSVKDLILYAKDKPDALSYGSSGIGTTAHLGTERFRSMAGITIVHVPFKGSGPALLALIAGQIQMEFTSSVSGMPHVKSGKLRALAVTGPIQALPDVPAVSDSGLPGFRLA